MTKKINYIANWHQYPRKKDWSGTTLSLLNALKKKVIINSINIKITRIVRGILKILHLRLYFEQKGIGKFSNKLDYLLYSNKIKAVLKNNKFPNLFISQDFGEMNFGGYIYQDLSVDSGFYAINKYPDTKKIIGNLSEKNTLWRRQEQINNYKKIDGIFTMGMWQKKVLIELSQVPENKIHHVGGGVNVDVTKIDYTQKKNNKILFIASGAERFFSKGGKTTIEGFKILKQKIPEIELYILGGYSSVENQIPGIFFVGYVAPEQMHYYYNLCDVFCMPSYYEGYGLVYVEALTFGLPCIARNRFEMPYFIEHGKTGFLIDDDDATLTAEYMYELLTNPEYTQNVRKKRAYYLHEYSWDTVAKKMLDIIFKNKT